MFGWFRKYVRKISIFGVEVEFHPPTEATTSSAPPKPTDPFVTSAAPLAEASPRVGSPPVVGRPGGSVAADKKAFLDKVEEYEGQAARADYERVLDDLIAWSEARGGLLTFSPRPAKNVQATVAYRFGKQVFWDAYPHKKHIKFSYEYDFDRERLHAEFAKLSADGRPASEKIPTMAFRDLVPEEARQRLKQLLGEVLAQLAHQPVEEG